MLSKAGKHWGSARHDFATIAACGTPQRGDSEMTMRMMLAMAIATGIAASANAQQYGSGYDRYGTYTSPPTTGLYSPSTPTGIGPPRTSETLGGAPMRNPQGGAYVGPSQQPLGGTSGPIGGRW